MKQPAKRYIRTLLSIGSTVILTACMADHGTCVADVDPQGWSAREKAVAVYEHRDTVSLYDLYVVVRHDERSAGQEFPITIETQTPDSLAFKDTITIRIPSRRFDRAVERNSSFFEQETPYRLHSLLRRQGVYRFRFTPIERSQIEGISAIGIRLRPSTDA